MPGALAAQTGPEVARAYREANEVAIVRNFAELLTYPNRASDLADITAAGRYIRDQLSDVGVEAELLELEGIAPAVYGELLVPGAERTLGIYVHYDGQPVDPRNWTHPPFEPTLYTASMEAGGRPRPMPEIGDPVDPEWRLYARSAGDDKAPIGALLPVLRAFREEGVELTSNLIFLFDGEEEAGSRNLGRYMEMRADRLDQIDVWLFFDGPAHQSGRPQLTFGVRGSMGMEVTVYGATRNLHSGHYGNWTPDTGNILARLSTSMKDENGRVLIDGWYDTVEPLGAEEREALESLPAIDAELKRELGLLWTEGEPETLSERILLPALNIRGITSGNTGALARNVIPNTAVASLGIRLVKGNEPAHMRQLVVDHIERQGFHVVTEDPGHGDSASLSAYREGDGRWWLSGRSHRDGESVRPGDHQRGIERRRSRVRLGVSRARAGSGWNAAALPVHRCRRQAGRQRPGRQPRQQSARAGREPPDREPLVRDGALRGAPDDARDGLLADPTAIGRARRRRRRDPAHGESP